MIDELKVKETTSSGKWWESLGTAIREARKPEEVIELESRIDGLQQAIVLHLYTTAGETIERLAQDAIILRSENLIMQKERRGQLGELSTAVQDVRQSIEDLKSRHSSGNLILQETEITLLTSTVQNISLTTCNFEKENAVLRSLDYSARTARHDSIPVACRNTFKWIFRERSNTGCPRFTRWLQHKEGPFWVTGRPGSGKSTLMRYITSHSDALLSTMEKVVAPCRAVLVQHYFWSAGTAMQRSQEGLFRSVLLQILAAIPDLTHALRDLDGKSTKELANETWTLDQLRAALDIVSLSADASVVVGIFIDGLDEYKGNHLDICKTLVRLSESPRIKLYVSNRPWNVFQDHFGQDKESTITVHDLTSNDITFYAEARLKEHHRWNTLATSNNEAEHLIREISKRSHGVFLWVFLATKVLREGMTNGDSLRDLLRRLDSIPDDLESFFRQILNSIDPSYHNKMAGTLSMALAAVQPLHIELYALSEGEYDDKDYAINQSLTVSNQQEIRTREDTFARRLNGRCKGLLEISPHRHVTFLHRTVRDFLRTKPMDDFLSSKNQTRLEPRLSIIKAYLSLMKQKMFTDGVFMDCTSGSGRCSGNFVSVLQVALCYAREEVTQLNQVEFLINEMESTTISTFSTSQTRIRPRSAVQSPRLLFRRCVLLCGPIHYLSSRLESSPKYFEDFAVPPLAVFLQNTSKWDSISTNAPNSGILPALRLLIHSGADPNEAYFDEEMGSRTTPWAAFVSHVIMSDQLPDALDQGIPQELVRFGAKPNVITMDEYSSLLPAWLNILFASFRTHLVMDVENGYMEVLTSLLEKGVDIKSAMLDLSYDESSATPPVAQWDLLSELVLIKGIMSGFRFRVLAKLAQYAGPDILPWDDLLSKLKSTRQHDVFHELASILEQGAEIEHNIGSVGKGERIREYEEPDVIMRAKRRKEE